MTPLPRALLPLAPGQPIPADRRGVLIPAGRIGDSAVGGAIVLVGAWPDLAILGRALAAGATRIALGDCRTGDALQRLATLLSVAEAGEGRAEGSTAILAMTDGILPAPAARESLAGKSRRLTGLVWDGRGLAEKLGVTRPLTQTGEWTAAFAAARAAVLLTAAAAGVKAYDAAMDLEGDAFALSCERSRDEGFHGRLATNATQAPVIEAIYAVRP